MNSTNRENTAENIPPEDLIITGEVSVMPICALFRYAEEELLTKKISRNLDQKTIGFEVEQMLLKDIDLKLYGYVDPKDHSIKPLTVEKLRDPSSIRISNELVLRILENGSGSLTGGAEAIYNTGKRVIELIPDLRRQLLYMKVFPPRFFLQLMKNLSSKFSTKTVEIDFIGKNRIHVRLGYPTELTKDRGQPTTKARCAGFRGAIESFMLFMELDNVEIEETACVADGAPSCEFEIKWTPPGFLNRLRNLILYALFRELVLSLQNAEATKDHEIFVITANLRAEHKKLESALYKLDDANRELERLSKTDSLTGLKNRGYFEKELLRLGKVMTRCSRDELSLLLIDIDHFKILNDTFGHQAGDQSLKRVAEIISKYARRPEDFAARYGGEEFVIVLPHTDSENAVAIAESIRIEVEESEECRPVPDHGITISLGIGTMSFNSGNLDSCISELISAADKNLYRAKECGRNRVYSDTSAQPES